MFVNDVTECQSGADDNKIRFDEDVAKAKERNIREVGIILRVLCRDLVRTSER